MAHVYNYRIRLYEDNTPWSPSAVIEVGKGGVYLEEALEKFYKYLNDNNDWHGFYSIEIIDTRASD